MIHTIRFRNFKGLRHVAMDLERFTVLVGPNASGKTSILEGLHDLSLFYHKNPQTLFVGANEMSNLYSRGAQGDLELAAFSSEGALQYLARPATPDRWVHEVRHRQAHWEEDHWNPVHRNSTFRIVPQAAFVRLEATRIAEPYYGEVLESTTGYDGTGLVSLLAEMALSDPDQFHDLQSMLQSIVPFVKRIRFRRVPVYRTETEVITVNGKRIASTVERKYLGESIVFDMDGAPEISSTLASEGTLLLLGLITVLMQPTRPKLILIDDVDRGLHPKAQRELVVHIERFLEQNPDVQVIATSHSPYLLDCLSPAEVRLTSLSDDGSVACARLDEHPDFEKWKADMTPGEFWSLVGEKWVSELRAKEKV